MQDMILCSESRCPELLQTASCLLAHQIRKSRVFVYSLLAKMRKPLEWKPAYETRAGLAELVKEYQAWRIRLLQTGGRFEERMPCRRIAC